MLIVDLSLNDEYQPDLHKSDVIRIPIEPHFAGGYRLEYDGKYVTLFGKDRNYPGFKLLSEEEDWYEEMILIPVVVERRNICPKIISVDDKWISVGINCVMK
jgi:hypothetical protein